MREMTDLSVSRETLEKLRVFEALAQKWTHRINLVSKGTVGDIWERHILDSAQIFSHAPSSGNWVDLGSGGGFPGVPCAILAQDLGSDSKFTMVESDVRKCAFLTSVRRELLLTYDVVNDRIEALPPLDADVLSARALADLNALLGFADHHLAEGGICLFPKGENWRKEVELARRNWMFDLTAIPSRTNVDAAVLKIKEIKRV